MKTIKILIIATALATTLGSVSVYAMDQDQENKEAEEVRQLQLTAQRTPHIAPFLPVPGVANIVSEYAAFTPEKVERANAALGTAIARDNQDGIMQALQSGANINQPNQYGNTPLLQAISRGTAETVRILIEARADVNHADQNGWTPLHYATSRGNAEIVRMLIEARADVNHANQDGWTPLSLACRQHRTAIVKMLAFHEATPSGHESEDMKEVIRQAQEARRQFDDQFGDQDWLPQELVESGILATHLQVKSIEELMSKLADPRAGIEDVEIQKLIEEQILKNKKQNAEKRSPAEESTDLPHRRMSVEQAAAQSQEDARAQAAQAAQGQDVAREQAVLPPLPQSQPEQLLPSHDGDNLYRPLAFYIDQLNRDERLAQSIKDSVIARLFQAAGDSRQLDVPTANAITISALEADGIRLHTMDLPVDSLPEERKDTETEEKNNAPEKSQQEQMREARLKRFDRKK